MNFFIALATLLAWLLSAPANAANSPALFNGGAVAGCTYTASSKSYDCPPFASNLDVTIADGYKVVLSGPITFDYNQKLTMSGSAQLQAAGNLDIGGINTANLSITGGSLLSSGQFRMGAQVQTIVADVSAASIKIGTGSSTKITGTLTATGQIDIASHATVVGPITGGKITTNSPVTLTGNVTSSVSFNLASGSTLNGNLVAPVVELDPSPSRVNGNVTASTSLTIGSSSSVNGNVVAGYVKLESSEAYITGNAVVNSIKLNWHGRVYQTITCPAPTPGSPCNCVDDDSGYANTSSGPVCSPAGSGGGSVHHYQISHSGGGLTCQPKTVTLRACADATCSVLYTGTATGTLTLLTPGTSTVPADVTPVAFSIASSDGANNASVRKASTGKANLAVAGASPAAANATVCVNGGSSSCEMEFFDAGFEVVVNNRKAEQAGVSTPFSVKALQNNDASPSSCIPLVASKTLPVTMRCAYIDPTSNANTASQNVNLGGVSGSAASMACTNGGIGTGPSGVVSLAFNASGIATGSLIYDDVGALRLAAEYISAGAPYPNLRGTSEDFVIVPHHYTVDAIQAAGPPVVNNPGATGAAGGAFIKAGAPFNATVTAVSARNINSGNFGREIQPGRVTLSHQLVDPVGGNAGVLGTAYTMTTSATPAKLSVAGIWWSEVGVMTLTAATNTANTNNNLYKSLPSDLVGTGTSGNIGRFYPSHFDTRLPASDSARMACPASGFPITCQGGQFVYSAQPLSLEVLAMNAAATPDVTRNYTGAYARAVSITAWNAAGASGAGANGVANSNPEWKPADAAASAGATGPAVTTPIVFTNGVGQGSVSYTFSTAFNTPGLVSPNQISRPVNVFFRATETGTPSDGVTSLRASGTAEAGIGVASGRLLVDPSYGTVLLSPLVNVQAQYWTGTQILRNTADATQSATALAGSGMVSFRNCTGTLNAGGGTCVAGLATAPPPATLLFTGGASKLRLSPAGAGKSGTAGVTVNAIPWLPSTIGRVTYGIFRSPVIYLREVY